jgi:hypothetical protein
MTDDGITLYGIIKGEEPLDLGDVGIDGKRVYTLSFEGISAVISHLPKHWFQDPSKETLLRSLTTYQSVIEKVMQTHPAIIPIKFGNLLPREHTVRHVLKQGQRALLDSLREIRQKVEMDVVVLWPDINAVLTQIGETDEIKDLKQEAATNTENVSALQIKVGKRVKDLLDEKRQELQAEILTPLSSIAEEYRHHSLMDDSMILNAAFLLKREEASRLEDMVSGLDRRYEDRINFRIIGPLPFYSFQTFEIMTADYAALNHAREVLGLEQETTQKEIRENYWRLTKKYHPDKFPADSEIQKKYEAINQAYKLINDYCREPSCSFHENDVRNWIRVQKVENSG